MRAAACVAFVMLALSGCPTIPEPEGEARSDGGSDLENGGAVAGDNGSGAGNDGSQPAAGGTAGGQPATAGRAGAPPDDGKGGEGDPGAAGMTGAAGSASAMDAGSMPMDRTCGNGVLDEGEECDDMLDREPRTCADFGVGTSEEPKVACHACVWEGADQCTCGNGTLDEHEDCDGDMFEGTCQSVMGHPGMVWTGTLGCQPDCHYDTSMCECMPDGAGGVPGGGAAGNAGP